MGGDEDDGLSEWERLRKELNVTNRDDSDLRSALKVLGLTHDVLDRVPEGVLLDFKELVDSNQSAVVATFLCEIDGLDLPSRIHLLAGLHSVTSSALE